MSHNPIFIAIATAGRRDVLTQTLGELSRQTRLPDEVFICPAEPADVDREALERLSLKVTIVTSEKGSCHQRNAIIARLAGEKEGLITFFDDDFFPRPDYLAETEALFAQHADIVIASGLVLADGATGPGLSSDEAHAILRAGDRQFDQPELHDLHNGYGCNMTVRLAALNRHAVRFDEALPLYGWLEDVDFSRQLSGCGRIVGCRRMQGVHLGAKRGRTSGLRFGYSQIANPWHLFRKKTMRADRALIQVARNVGSNVTRVLRPEPWVDRKGRLLGNALAVLDLMRGRISPANILKLK
ncbi:glycosyltransferase family 2 protein [Bosea lathyri]|uniref:Glycosyltransferase, GT2 family n=1 Tax=Bosea lathyri TaxID=1036778 RepID=A0A1H5YT68_9HYPH|nr:glycosyltransferase family 2 protein [Bosea lathyri]SEG26506.1 Glycosyltransferase, GT2 family [Bosea lathyri]